MRAETIQGHSFDEIYQALQQVLSTGFLPTLAIVFTSIKHDRGQLSILLSEHGIAIFGATSNGEIIDAETQTGSIALLLLDISPVYFKVMFAELSGGDETEATQKIASQAKKGFDQPGFLIAGSHLEADDEMLLKGFSEELGPDVEVFGGLAGDDATFNEQFVFTNGQSSNRAVVALALDGDKISIKGVATGGWKGSGTEKTITHSEGRVVYTINNEPALDFMAKYGGISIDKEDRNNLNNEFGANFTLQLQRNKGSGNEACNSTKFKRPIICLRWACPPGI